MEIGNKDKVGMLVILSIAAIMCLSVIGFSSMSAADSAIPKATNDEFLKTPILPGEGIIPGSGFGIPDTDAMNASALYLIHAQADVTEDNALNNPEVDPDDGGWDWVLTYPTVTHSASASPTNIYGATALGLYYSYMATQMNSITPNTRYMIAMTDAANKMVANANIRSASDLIYLMLYDDLPSMCGTTYQASAKAKYDARITTYGSATAFAQYIRDVRCASYPNGIIAWDIGAWVKVAAMLNERYPGLGYDLDADAMAEVIYQDSFMGNLGCFDIILDQGFDPTYANVNYWWYTLGITGIIDAFDAAQVHTDKIPQLLGILTNCQYPSGAFSGSYGANPNDEDWQSTAYAVMTLGNLNAYTYRTQIQLAASWIESTQHTCGGWVYSDNTHYPEVCGELTSALYFNGPVFNTNTGDVFWSIEAAQDNKYTLNGHTILVEPGTYRGNIIVYKELTIKSENSCEAIINADQIDVCNFRNSYCKGITYAWAIANDPGLVDNGFLVFSNNTIIDGFKIINANYYDYNRGIGVIIGSISTTYVSWWPWNIDQWGGTKPISQCYIPKPHNVIIRNNCIVGASDGIYNWASNNNIIEYNTITNSVTLGGMGIQCYEGGTNNIIRGNTMNNIVGAGISVCGAWPSSLLDCSNTLIYDNTVTNSNVGIQFYNMGGSGVKAYHNNLLNNNRGIVVEGVGDATVGIAYENNIAGNTQYGVINTCPTGVFSALCNWWGAANGPGTVGPGTGDKVSTNVNYGCPWLNAAYPGGQCIGGTVCWNVQTGEYFCSIQAAIDDADTNNNAGDHDTIEVFDGVHYEHVNVHKSLTITLDPNRAPTIIDGGGTGNGFLISAPNVIIDGFEIRNCQIGIRSQGWPANFQDLTIQNCYIHDNTQNGILVVYDTFDDLFVLNCDIVNNGQNGIGMGNTAKITHLWVTDCLITGQGHHNMFFSNVQITTITLVNTDLTNTDSWGAGMTFNTQASTIGTLYIEGGSMNGNAGGLYINQAPSTFTQQIWLNGVDISYNRESGVLLGGGTTAQNLKVEHCTFTGNAWEDFDLSGGWFGAFNSPTVRFEHNDFNGNAWCAIYIGNAGNLPNIVVFENNFYNPSLYAIYNEKTTTVQATCNYYGHNTGPRHTSMPSCTQGRYVYGNAVVKPYLYAAYPGGICIQPVIANPDGPYYGNVGQIINFIGSASGGQSPYTYYWTLGDGTTSTLQNPTNIYWTAGYYPITLTVTDSLGLVSCTATTSATIVPVGTNCVPEVWVDDDYTTSTPGWQVTHFALLQFALDAVCPGGIVHVYPGDYAEDLNAYTAHVDGVTIIGENIPLTYDILPGNAAIINEPLQITGDYNTVNYLVFNTDSNGAVIVSGDNAVVQYNKFLRDCLDYNPIGIENLGTTTLDARYNWWGRPDGPSGNTLDANTGRIADGLGVTIINNGPILFDSWAGIDAVAEASETVVETGESILFNSLIESFAYHFDGTINDYDVYWDFGDGVYSFDKQIAHIYNTVGTYYVSLRIQSQDPQLWGAFMYDWDYITITVTAPGAPLSANADGSSLDGYETTVDTQIQLYGLAIGGTQPYTYSWDLGDGISSDLQNPTHIYKKAGTYTATLIVTDSVGAIATDTTEITVNEIGELTVKIVTDKNTITGIQNLFTASVTGGKTPYTYNWNFGDGITSTEQNPTHIYEEIGTYTVTLTVTDKDNNRVSDTTIIIVDEGESDIIPAEIKQVNGGIRITATIKAGNTDCDWTIKVNANFMLRGGQASGTIQANTEETTTLPLTFAFGKVDITVTANEIQKQYTAFALGPIFLNIKEI